MPVHHIYQDDARSSIGSNGDTYDAFVDCFDRNCFPTLECWACGTEMCQEHTVSCPKCNRYYCEKREHGFRKCEQQRCRYSKIATCIECYQHCYSCEKTLCRSHFRHTDRCQSDDCAYMYESKCDNCSIFENCDSCNQPFHSECISHKQCSLKPQCPDQETLCRQCSFQTRYRQCYHCDGQFCTLHTTHWLDCWQCERHYCPSCSVYKKNVIICSNCDRRFCTIDHEEQELPQFQYCSICNITVACSDCPLPCFCEARLNSKDLQREQIFSIATDFKYRALSDIDVLVQE